MHNVHASSDLDAIRPAIHRRFSLVGPHNVRFSIDLRHSDGYLTGFSMICDWKLSVKYFFLPSQQWAPQKNIEIFHREKQTGHTAAIFEETPAMTCDGL